MGLDLQGRNISAKAQFPTKMGLFLLYKGNEFSISLRKQSVCHLSIKDILLSDSSYRLLSSWPFVLIVINETKTFYAQIIKSFFYLPTTKYHHISPASFLSFSFIVIKFESFHWFSLSTVGIPGVEHRSPGFLASTFSPTYLEHIFNGAI